MENPGNQSGEPAAAVDDPPLPPASAQEQSSSESSSQPQQEQQRPPPPPLSPLTGSYLLIIVGEPHSERHKEIILQKIAKAFLSWDVAECHVSLEKELQVITGQSPEGEEARHGERLIQYATENLVTEILIHPQLNTLHQCLKNLLSSFTKHRHIIHAGYTFAGNGSWILQDGTLSISDLIEALHEPDVLRVLRAYENSVSIDVHCAPEGDWTTERFQKEPVSKLCGIRINPGDVMTAGNPAISAFMDYLAPFLEPANIQQLLQPTDVVGNIRFTHPTLYVFPGGQGDAALFGINGFNMLIDGGFARKACFWDFARHLDRLDAVLLTRLNNSTVNGISAVLQRKKMNHVYPQIGHFFCNLQDRKIALSPDGDKDKDSLIVNLAEEGHEIVANLKHLALKPHPCYRDGNQVDPVNLYHKVGHGKLDMYVISPARDSQAVKEFLTKWSSNDNHLFNNTGKKVPGKAFEFPLQNLVSICALLVWQPANPNDTITRILFPGSTPQHKIFEGLEKLRHLEFLKHPVCSAKSISPSASTVGVTRSLSKTKQPKPVDNKPKETKIITKQQLKPAKPKVEKTPPKEMKSKLDNKLAEEKNELENIEEPLKKLDNRILSKDEQIENIKKEIQKIEQAENEEQKKKIVHRSKYDMRNVKSKVDSRAPSKSVDRKKMLEKKPEGEASPPSTPKNGLSNGTATKAEKAKVGGKPGKAASPTSTPAKSAKEANNRKVVESRVTTRSSSRTAPKKKEETPPPSLPAIAKTERKPISRRPKAPPSPVKSSTGKPLKADPDSVLKKIKKKIDVDATVVKAVGQRISNGLQKGAEIEKTDIEKGVHGKIEIKLEAETTENKETDIKAVKNELKSAQFELTAKEEEDEEEEEEEEYLIITKEEYGEESAKEDESGKENEEEVQTKDETEGEGEMKKLLREEEESEKKREAHEQTELATEEENKKEGEKKKETEEKEIEPEVTQQRDEGGTEIAVQDRRSESPGEKTPEGKESELQRLMEVDEGIDLKEPASKEHKEGESLPEEKMSNTLETSATTAPTLPEDERIEEPVEGEKDQPEDIKEVVEEKYIQEKTKEEKQEGVIEPVEQLDQPQALTIIDVEGPPLGVPSAQKKHPRDVVKTPDEVAELPMHEEVDPRMYSSGEYSKELQRKPEEEKHEKLDFKATIKGEANILDEEEESEKAFERETEKESNQVEDSVITKYLNIIDELERAAPEAKKEFVKEEKEKLEDPTAEVAPLESEDEKEKKNEIEKCEEEDAKTDIRIFSKSEDVDLLQKSGIKTLQTEETEKMIPTVPSDLTETSISGKSTPLGLEKEPSTCASSIGVIKDSSGKSTPHEFEKVKNLSGKSTPQEQEKDDFGKSSLGEKETETSEKSTLQDFQKEIPGKKTPEELDASRKFTPDVKELYKSSTPHDLEKELTEIITSQNQQSDALNGSVSPNLEKEVHRKSSVALESNENVSKKSTSEVKEEELFNKISAAPLSKDLYVNLQHSEEGISKKSSQNFVEGASEKVLPELKKNGSGKSSPENFVKDISAKSTPQLSGETTPKDLDKNGFRETTAQDFKTEPSDGELMVEVSERLTPLGKGFAEGSIPQDLAKDISGKSTPQEIEKSISGKSTPDSKLADKEISSEIIPQDLESEITEKCTQEISGKSTSSSKVTDQEISREPTPQNVEKELSGKSTPQDLTKDVSREPSPQNVDKELSKQSTPQDFTKDISREPTPQNVDKELSGKSTPQDFAKDISREPTPQNVDKELSGKSTPQDFTKDISREPSPQNVDKELSGKSTPQDFTKDISREPTPQNVDKELSGKSTPQDFTKDISREPSPQNVDKELSGKSTPQDFTKKVSGKSTPQDMTKEISREPTPQNVEKELSGQSTPQDMTKDISREPTPQNVEKELSGKSTPQDFTKDISGKSTPHELAEESFREPSPQEFSGKFTSQDLTKNISNKSSPLESEIGTFRELTPQDSTKQISKKSASKEFPEQTSRELSPQDFTKDTSGKSTPLELTKDTSGKSTPLELTKDTSGKSTPLELTKDTSGKSTPLELAKDTSGKSTPLELTKDTSGKSTPLELAKDISGKSTPLELAKDTSGKSTPLELAKDNSGKSTPLDVTKHFSGKSTPHEIVKESSRELTPVDMSKQTSREPSPQDLFQESSAGQVIPSGRTTPPHVTDTDIANDEAKGVSCKTSRRESVPSNRSSPAPSSPRTSMGSAVLEEPQQDFREEKSTEGVTEEDISELVDGARPSSGEATPVALIKSVPEKPEEKFSEKVGKKIIENSVSDSVSSGPGEISGKSTPFSTDKEISGKISPPPGGKILSDSFSIALAEKGTSGTCSLEKGNSEKISSPSPVDISPLSLDELREDSKEKGDKEKDISGYESLKGQKKMVGENYSGKSQLERLRYEEGGGSSGTSTPDRSHYEKSDVSIPNGTESDEEPEKGILESERQEKESQILDISSGEEEELKALGDDEDSESEIRRDDAEKGSVTRTKEIAKGEKDGINQLVKIGGGAEVEDGSDSDSKPRVKRMLVTASSEDGGTETEICIKSGAKVKDEEAEEGEFINLILQARKEYNAQRSRKTSHNSSEEAEEADELVEPTGNEEEELGSLLQQARQELAFVRLKNREALENKSSDKKYHTKKTTTRSETTRVDNDDDLITITTVFTEEREEQEDGSVKVTTTKETTTTGGKSEGTVVTVNTSIERKDDRKPDEDETSKQVNSSGERRAGKDSEGKTSQEEATETSRRTSASSIISQEDLVSRKDSAKIEDFRQSSTEMSPLKTTYITSSWDSESLMTSSFYGNLPTEDEMIGRSEHLQEFRKGQGYESYTEVGPNGERTERTYFYGGEDDPRASRERSRFVKAFYTEEEQKDKEQPHFVHRYYAADIPEEETVERTRFVQRFYTEETSQPESERNFRFVETVGEVPAEHVDFAKAIDEHMSARGEHLGKTDLAKFTNGKSKEDMEEGTSGSAPKADEEKPKDVIEGWGKPLGLPLPPKTINKTYSFPGQNISTTSTLSTPTDNSDSISNWGHPMNLPSPAPPPTLNGTVDTLPGKTGAKETPKKEKKIPPKKNIPGDNKSSGTNTPNRRAESPVKQIERRTPSIGRTHKPASHSHVYLDLTYVPHHGNSYYSNVEFFKKVRARYYVFSGTEPSKEVYNALLEAKQTWEDKKLEVTIIPTYDTDVLGYWVAENEEILAQHKIDLSPSASRCTINLQDHETSCSAYRLEF